VDFEAFRVRENGVALANVERSGNRIPLEGEKPCLPFGFEAPYFGRCQIDPLEHEVGI
jgi:hypothetical protein